MLNIFAALLALACLGIAGSTNTDCKPIKEAKIAQFDNLEFSDGSMNSIPPHYYGLSYFTFQVDQYDGFIPPTSGNQWAMAFGGRGNISIPDS
jgi:hypothetical protein